MLVLKKKEKKKSWNKQYTEQKGFAQKIIFSIASTYLIASRSATATASTVTRFATVVMQSEKAFT